MTGTHTPGSRALMALVFLAGIGSMTTEICASRLLAPYFGSSTIVWANIIGMVLASLSIGYWLGGRLADRHPSARLLGSLVLAGAVLVAAVPFAARPFLNLSVRALDQLQTGALIGSLAASVLLFVPPVLLLGTVSPFAIRLAVQGVEGAGAVAGRVFALSTAGSLLGTFVPALVTIELVGTQRTMIGAAALVALAAALLLGPRWLAAGVVVAGLLIIPPGIVKDRPGLIYEQESTYQFIQVVRQGDARYLYLNEGQAVHSVWRANTVFTGGEWDMFLTLPALIGRTPAVAAMLGNAGGTTGRAYGTLFPATRYDGVELDAAVTAAGRRYFGLNDNPNMHVFTADARPWLRASGQRFDLIMIDAYRQPYVPFYLATREFFRLVRDRLAPGGAVALNVTTLPGDTRLARAVAGTLATEFPVVVIWQALRFNQLVVGLRDQVSLDELRARLRAAGGQVRPLTQLFAGALTPAAPSDDPWTDDRAPVEWITDRMIVAFGEHGGSLAEQLLPTAPR
jgi:spermidine synthase